MQLLITGSSSTFGKKLVSELVKQENCSVRLLEHETAAYQAGCEIISGDVRNVDSLTNACGGVDVVIHLAALSYSHHEKLYFDVNEGGTRNLITACKKNSIDRLVFVSTGAASEKGGAYAVSKLRAEELVRASGLQKWVIVRPSEIYGPEMKEGIKKIIDL